MRRQTVFFLIFLCAVVLVGCTAVDRAPAASESTAVPLPTVTAVPTEAPAPTATATPSPTPTPEPQPFSILWIPDTQNMTVDDYAPIEAIADWAEEHAAAENIRYAVHTGDIVNSGLRDSSWERIAPSMQRIAAAVPLITAAGNHDIGRGNTGDYSFYLRWRFDAPLPEAQLFQGGRGSYALLDTDVGEFILAAIGAYPNEESFAWLRETFAKYPERIGILVNHDYLRPSGAHTSYGKMVYEQAVVPSKNVRFVLCGHNGGIAYRVDALDDDGDGTADRSVQQMMLNHQDDEKRTGYVRILTFAPDRSLTVDTYSPYVDDHDYYTKKPANGEESFILENAF